MDFAKMVDIHTGSSDMLLLIAIEIQTAQKRVESTVNELMETIANKDTTVDLSMLDSDEANPFVEKAESGMEREVDALLEKMCYTCFKQHSHTSFHLQSTSLE